MLMFFQLTFHAYNIYTHMHIYFYMVSYIYCITTSFFHLLWKSPFVPLHIDQPHCFSRLYRIPVFAWVMVYFWSIFGLFLSLAHASHAVNILVCTLGYLHGCFYRTGSEKWISYFHFALWNAITFETPKTRAIWPLPHVFSPFSSSLCIASLTTQDHLWNGKNTSFL